METTPCQLWTGAVDRQGYGRTKHNGRSTSAHRAAYVKAHSLPLDAIKGQIIRHRCDVVNCVNPDHLEPGTQLDNMNDMAERGRRVSLHGTSLPQSKLTESDIPDVRAMLAAGILQKHIAAKYGVSIQTISQVKLGRWWKHVE